MRGFLLLLQDRCALLGARVARGLDVGRLAVEPGLVLVERHDPDAREHVGVVAPAQLGALALVGAGLRGLEPGLVDVAGDGVHLAAERGDPPRVGDVVGGDVERDGHADRHDHLLVGEDVLVALRGYW